MIRNVDPRLPPDVLFLIWAMGHGDEVAVVDADYATLREGDGGVPRSVQMNDVDTPQAVGAILSALQLDTTFVAHPVTHLEDGRADGIRQEVQGEVDQALGYACSISAVPVREFHEQVKNCYGLVRTGDRRRQGLFILRKGLDVTPASVVSVGGRRSRW